MAMPFFPGSYGGMPQFPFTPGGFSPYGMSSRGAAFPGQAQPMPMFQRAGGPQPMQPAVPQRGASQSLGAAFRTPIPGYSTPWRSSATAAPQPFPVSSTAAPGSFPGQSMTLAPQAMRYGFSPYGGMAQAAAMPPMAVGGGGFSPFGRAGGLGGFPSFDPALLARAIPSYAQRLPLGGGGYF